MNPPREYWLTLFWEKWGEGSTGSQLSVGASDRTRCELWLKGCKTVVQLLVAQARSWDADTRSCSSFQGWNREFGVQTCHSPSRTWLQLDKSPGSTGGRTGLQARGGRRVPLRLKQSTSLLQQPCSALCPGRELEIAGWSISWAMWSDEIY